MATATTRFHDPSALADAIIERAGRKIVLLLPLALGKSIPIANALFDKACADTSIELEILTALSLEQPSMDNELQRRFLGPARARLFGDAPPLHYVPMLRQGRLPANIRVHEFFLRAGAWLNAPQTQQDYISANFTHAIPFLRDRGVNLITQMVAPPQDPDSGQFSLSCNADATADLLALRRRGEVDFVLAVQPNPELPFMDGDAVLDAAEADLVLEGEAARHPLFAVPKRPVSAADYAIGLHSARLVPDGGTLQIGIGSIGDAIVQALRLRHEQNALFRELLEGWQCERPPELYHDAPFEQGLYANSEMFVSGFLPLYDAGILKREVQGAVLHAAFFIDERGFYERLRAMPWSERQRFRMMGVGYTNELLGDEQGKRAARVQARFINNAMKATLHGAVVSDALEDGRVVSGVGGQYNFVAQAFALEGARSVITLNATRQAKDGVESNIVWRYGHQTIPWHLRDLVVTEYGVADLRGKSDAETIAALLAVADARFQPELLAQAKQAGKLPASYQIPERCRRNRPETVQALLAPLEQRGLMPRFPFGTDFTAEEQRLLPALEWLKAQTRTRRGQARVLLAALRAGTSSTEPSTEPSNEQAACLERMGLAQPSGLKERFYRRLLQAALAATASNSAERGAAD
jgi:hypothetical protein